MPKYPDPSIVDRVDSASMGADRNQEFPIMSISKSFCGVVSTLMALEGKFGEKGLEASLAEVLTIAAGSHPERLETITAYQKMLAERNLGDIRLAELLTHRSGIDEKIREPEFYQGKPFLDIASQNLNSNPANRGQYNYYNGGFAFLEEILNLTSDSGSYKTELQSRVFDKCQMTKSGNIYDRPESMSKVELKIFPDENGQLQKFSNATHDPHAFGRIPIAAGALSSTINDLDKFGKEFVLMVAGKPNLLTENPQEVAAIYAKYRGENSYSLGVNINESEQGLTIMHGGGLPANLSLLQITLGKDDKVESEIFMQQMDGRARLMQQDKEPLNMIWRDYFNEKLSEEERQKFEKSPLQEIEEFLIKEKKLPPEFVHFRSQLFSDFIGEINGHLNENYLGADGIIDREKLARDFNSMQEITAAIILPAQQKARESMARFDLSLVEPKQEVAEVKQEQDSPQQKPEREPADDSQLATDASKAEMDSWVKKMAHKANAASASASRD